MTVAVTSVVWLAVTFATRPESEATLTRFYERVRPGETLGVALLDWVAGCGLVYGTLFGIGKFCLGEPVAGIAYLVFAIICGAIILRDIERRDVGVSADRLPTTPLVRAARTARELHEISRPASRPRPYLRDRPTRISS